MRLRNVLTYDLFGTDVQMLSIFASICIHAYNTLDIRREALMDESVAHGELTVMLDNTRSVRKCSMY